MAALQSLPRLHAITASRPAEPFLASSLVDAASLDVFFEDDGSGAGGIGASFASPEILRTGVTSVDDALGNTVRSGRVVAFSSETSSQRDDLAKALLADCLVGYPESVVAVIDTTGNFDVVGLYAQMLGRMQKGAGEVGAGSRAAVGEGNKKRRLEDVAAEALDRVKIMRVFDFVGVGEAVGELRGGLEGRPVRAEDVEKVNETDRETSQPPPRKRIEIADSEDEDEDMEASDDEMLFDKQTPPTNPSPAAKPVSPPAIPRDQTNTSNRTPHQRVKLILIDNLAHVLTPLLKKDAPSANTLATTFLTTLADLSRTHALHTILLNPCTSPRPVSLTRQAASHTNLAQAVSAPAPQSYKPLPPPSPSVFSSNTAVPGLLGLLGRYADAHVLITRMPRRKMDARVYYAESGVGERGKQRGVEMVSVLEVVADRWGERVGAWGTIGEGKKARGV